jgi:hypothetical protein
MEMMKMRIRDFKINSYYRKMIKELAYEYEVNPKVLYNNVKNPFFIFNNFPKGHSDYLRKFKNMRHYILCQLYDILLLKRSVLSGLNTNKKELIKINRDINTLHREINKIKKKGGKK